MPWNTTSNGDAQSPGTWLSRAMDVVSDLMALAMPKSMSLSCPSTMRKLAGFRSECTMRASWIVSTACQYAHVPCLAVDCELSKTWRKLKPLVCLLPFVVRVNVSDSIEQPCVRVAITLNCYQARTAPTCSICCQ